VSDSRYTAGGSGPSPRQYAANLRRRRAQQRANGNPIATTTTGGNPRSNPISAGGDASYNVNGPGTSATRKGGGTGVMGGTSRSKAADDFNRSGRLSDLIKGDKKRNAQPEKQMTIGDVIAAALGIGKEALGEAPTVNPSLIDINSVKAPFAQAQTDVRKQAEMNKGELMRTAAEGVRARRAYADTDAKHYAAEQQRVKQQNEARLHADDPELKADVAALRAQGVDEGVVQNLIDEQAANKAQIAAQNQASTNATNDAAALAKNDQASIEFEGAARERGYGDTLQVNLMNAITSILAEQAGAVAQAEQQNAASTNEANQINAQAAYDQNASLADLEAGISEGVAKTEGDPDIYKTPGRGAVKRWLQNSISGKTNADSETIIRQAIQAEDEESALKLLAQGMDKASARKYGTGKGSKQINFNERLLQELVRKWYQTSDVVRPEAADDLIGQFVRQMGGGGF
jgi:hypothetical protein